MSKRPPLITAAKEELAAWVKLKTALEQDDPRALFDTLDGETNLTEALAALYFEHQERIADLAGLDEWLARLADRKARLRATIETIEGVIVSTMDKAGMASIPTAIGTFGVRKTGPRVVVTDEAAIPSRFFKSQPPALDKSALGDALKDGEEILGASLSNGGIGFLNRVR